MRKDYSFFRIYWLVTINKTYTKISNPLRLPSYMTQHDAPFLLTISAIRRSKLLMNKFKILIAATIGNALEIYDLVVYGYFSTAVGKNFFPQADKLASIASAFAIFFIGYLARPLGALFFGRIGDTLGRKPALITSIWLMALSTFALGLLPTYQSIGVWASLLFLILRICQGFSCGGELTGSTIFLVEYAPETKRGFYGSFAYAGANLGLLLASLVAWLTYHYFGDVVVVNWAWRLPFFLGLLIGIVGWWARRQLSETPLFRSRFRTPESQFDYYREFRKYRRPVGTIVGLVIFGTVLTYLIYVFNVVYMSDMLDYTRKQALSITMVSIVLLVFIVTMDGKME